jgi:hypothetical protein
MKKSELPAIVVALQVGGLGDGMGDGGGGRAWMYCNARASPRWVAESLATHVPPSLTRNPPPPKNYQDAGLLIGRRQHGAHHRPNFDGNYCIVSGWWNAPLDNVGFFRWLEKVVAKQTGVEPRCWYPPEHDWEEQVRPEAAS